MHIHKSDDTSKYVMYIKFWKGLKKQSHFQALVYVIFWYLIGDFVFVKLRNKLKCETIKNEIDNNLLHLLDQLTIQTNLSYHSNVL